MRISAHGISVDLPTGWDARIWLPSPSTVTAPPALRLGETTVPAGGTTNAVCHLANFPLPARRGDYGSGAVEQMGPRHVFAALVEFDPEAASTPMFSTEGVPRVRATRFHPRAMQRVIPGMAGAQWFFHLAGRAFCLYAVVGSNLAKGSLSTRLDAVLRTVVIAGR